MSCAPYVTALPLFFLKTRSILQAFRWWVACMAAGPRTNHIVLYPEGLVRLQRRQMLGNGPRNWARCVWFNLPPTIWTPGTGSTAFKGRGGVMAYTGRLHSKEVSFQASGLWKGRDFTCWSIWKGSEICHLGPWKGSIKLTEKFMAQ